MHQRSYKTHICTQSTTYVTLSQCVPRRLYEMHDSGRGLWSQDLCSDTINVTPLAPRTRRVTFS